MTSQVVLLNSLAVSMASDSIISQLQNDHSYKTRATSEKILPLTNHSIAVMTSGESELAGFPIESLVWEWSRALRMPLETVEQYLESFLRWLEKLPELASLSRQENFYKRLINEYLKGLWDATADWNMSTEQSSVVDEADLSPVSDFNAEQLEALNNRITVWTDWVKNSELLSNLDESWSRGVSFQFSEMVNERIAYWFDDRPLSDIQVSQIHGALQRLAAIYNPNDFGIGLVFAGFGDKDLLPKCVSVNLYDVLSGRVRHSEAHKTSGYSFFGQWKHSVQFIRGIDSDFQENVLHQVGHIVQAKLNGHGASFSPQPSDDASGDTVSVSRESIAKEVSDELREHVEKYANDAFVSPFMQVIRLSPESDLSRMAHTLVEIEAIRQSINQSTPTVGGPIDVAVISKVNGFRWVSHKTL